MKSIYIYTLSDPETKQIRYVGKSNNPKKRFLNHKWNDRKCKLTSWLRSLKSLGQEPLLEIIDEVCKNEWKFWERYWISQCKAWGFRLTNMTEGGEGFATGDLNPAHLEHVKQQKSKRHKGKVISQEMRDRISETLTGRKNPEHSLRMKGKKQSDDSKDKISKALKGRAKPDGYWEKWRQIRADNKRKQNE